ncbi:MAG: AAA family ATPase [Deltaproteobacteria bacterium]|nr:MAG: AAA family ATPase [Deltaproteobacteria bacterium]
MYEQFFGLREKPFNLTPDPHFLYLSTVHREAIDHLYYGLVRGEGFICIYGEVGVGKTTICREILRMLDERFVVSYVLNPFLTEKELLRTILGDFGVEVPGKGTKKDLMDALERFLLRCADEGRNPVVIIDEAQNLSPALLEQIRVISNFEGNKRKLIQIVFVGQKELREMLAKRGLRQLNQRITVRYEIEPLTREETARYIHHRLVKAGSRGDLVFSERAVKRIHRKSSGIPRLINVLADRALLSAYVRNSFLVDVRDVKEGEKSLGEADGLFPKRRGLLAFLTG